MPSAVCAEIWEAWSDIAPHLLCVDSAEVRFIDEIDLDSHSFQIYSPANPLAVGPLNDGRLIRVGISHGDEFCIAGIDRRAFGVFGAFQN